MGDSVVRTYTIPNWKSAVRPLVAADHQGQDNVGIHCKIKYELLITYASLNDQKEQGEGDAGWDEELHDGSLRKTIETVFDPTVTQDIEEAENVKLLAGLLVDILFEGKF